ncbi:MAG: indole-3-glycerol phosphate synthase TrpC [Planctomycetes bacterium]|nr:indole-3-glycerol phosphate synthase TrpC [Planctomycetota bacterium]
MNILDKIVATKHREVAERKSARPESELRTSLDRAPATRDFLAPLAEPGPVKLIAEVKKASPSRGVLREDFDPLAIASAYEASGAACLSVLTDETFFQGRLDHLESIRAGCRIPVLRKDFVIDAYQVWEARLAGADAVLLIAECLDDRSLRNLHQAVRDAGMTALVEFHDAAQLPRVLDVGPRLIGVNNRNLKTFHVDLAHTLRMRERIPDGIVVVGESGIRTPGDVERLRRAGVQAMLVGESLVTRDDIGEAVRGLLGRPG